ncbi:MAG: RNA polymerase sigma factor [Odoribacter splanchnicus]
MTEDCVQDAVYKAYEQWVTFKSVLTLKVFLYSCIHHAAIDILRKKQAQSNYLSQQDYCTEFLNNIIEQENLNLLYDSIERLPKNTAGFSNFISNKGSKMPKVSNYQALRKAPSKKTKSLYAGPTPQRPAKTNGQLFPRCYILLKRLK